MPLDGKELSPTTHILMRALAILDEKGWCQHTGVDEDGRHCIAGAIHRAAIRTATIRTATNDHNIRASFRLVRCVLFFDHHAGIVPYNDAPGRTYAEVRAVLIRAICISMESDR